MAARDQVMIDAYGGVARMAEQADILRVVVWHDGRSCWLPDPGDSADFGDQRQKLSPCWAIRSHREHGVAVVRDGAFDGVEVGAQVRLQLGEVEEVVPQDHHRRTGGVLRSEVLREPLVCGEEHRVVLSTPREDVLVRGALHAQITGVLRVVPSAASRTASVDGGF